MNHPLGPILGPSRHTGWASFRRQAAARVLVAVPAPTASLPGPLDYPLPAADFASEDEPIYRELVAALGIPGLGDWPTGHPVLRGEIEPPTMPLRLAAVGA